MMILNICSHNKGEVASVRKQRIRSLLCVVVLVLIVSLLALDKGKAGGAVQGKKISIVVEKGDSLWSIAKKIAPDHDANEVIWYLMRLNGKENKIVREGELLIFDYATIN